MNAEARAVQQRREMDWLAEQPTAPVRQALAARDTEWQLAFGTLNGPHHHPSCIGCGARLLDIAEAGCRRCEPLRELLNGAPSPAPDQDPLARAWAEEEGQ